MPVIILRLSPNGPAAAMRAEECPRCGSSVLQGWGKSVRRVQDAHTFTTEISRYRCTNCGHTFRHYPLGIDHASYSARIRRLGAVAWILGLSHREVAQLFHDHQVTVSYSTIWREGQRLFPQASICPERRSFRFSLDREFVRAASPRLGVVVAVDFGDGHAQVLGTLDSGSARDVTQWLEALVAGTGIEVRLLATGRLDACDPGATRSPAESAHQTRDR